jgi:hypothetical protein
LLEVQFKGKECKVRRNHTNLKLPFNDNTYVCDQTRTAN